MNVKCFKPRIMKTKNLLKVMFTVVAIFAVAATFAQTHEPYTEMSNEFAATGDNDTVTVSNTVTKWLPYYVEPDNVLNSMSADYDPTTDPESQGIYTSFGWSFDGTNGGGTASLQYQPDAANDTVPYVEVQFTGTNTDADTLIVTETSDGGCAGDPVKLPIVVVNEPVFDVTTDTDNDTIEICDSPGYAITVASIADNGITGGNLKFEMDSTVETLNADMSVKTTEQATTTVYPTIPENGNLGGTDVTVFTHDLTTRNGDITRYSFIFNGMSDHISRKTDYLALADRTGGTDSEFNYYGPTTGGNGKVFIVYPTPNTGDIYYIPNDFNQ